MAKAAAKEKTLDPTSEAKGRARRRLIGAAVVTGLAAALLAMVLDREPRPVTPDVVLKGPQNTPPLSPPLVPPAPTSNAALPPASSSPAAPAAELPSTAPAQSAAKTAPVVPAPSPTAAQDDSQDTRRPPLVLNPAPNKTTAKDTVKDAPKPSPIDPIEKLTQDKPAKDPAPSKPASPAAKGSYALQVGAFANKESANNALAKLKAAGLAGYIETVSTAQGERMRVRAGPYKDRDAAQAAHGKLKSAGIDAALIAPQ